MKTLVGIVTFGNLEFTKLTINSIKETTKNSVDFYVVVGKPGDYKTWEWLDEQKIAHTVHAENMGFPYSLNDIYDYAWKLNDYDNLIIAGNDIVVYPEAVDSLIDLAESTEYEVISALQYDVKSLVNGYPETRRFFKGSAFIFNDFSATPWKVFESELKYGEVTIADMQLFDIQNLCLYKKSIFDRIGYTDVNFYPAYYIDNDYARRIVVAGIRCCTVTSARFFHFWSRTIHQGSGGSTSKNFDNNKAYYIQKWNGDFGFEQGTPPILINYREGEEEIVRKWRSKN